jgi:hypothetical protein
MTYALAAPTPPERRAPDHPRGRAALRIAGRILGGLVVAALGAVQGLFWLLIAGFTCDESCSDAPATWHEDADAWQWAALGWLGAACFALCVAFAVAFAVRRPGAAKALLGAAIAVGAVPWLLSGSL